MLLPPIDGAALPVHPDEALPFVPQAAVGKGHPTAVGVGQGVQKLRYIHAKGMVH